MAEVPATADVVVIGAGIVGNSLVHHLTRLGWTDVVQIDKGALPNPGGSTGPRVQLHLHRRPLPRDHRPDARLGRAVPGDGRLHAVRAASRSPAPRSGWRSCAGACPAHGRGGSRRSWSAPAFVKEKVPFIEADQFVGAFWTPGVGVVDSLRAGTIMRERALATGELTVVPTVEVVGTRHRGRPARRATDHPGADHRRRHRGRHGRHRGRRLEPASSVTWPGVSIPLTPAVHQMISVGPCPQLAETEGEISFPIIRDMDTFCYERQHGADMEVGSYAHRAILHEPEDIPSIEQARLSPTEMPFTSDDFDPQLEQAYELMPELLGAEGAEMRYAINGLLSLTCDGNPILGESEVAGLWTAAAVWIKEGPGVGRAVAEWMTHGHSEIDVHHSDIARFHHPPEAARAHPAAHHRVVHQDLRHRPPGRAVRRPTATSGSRPMHASQQKLGGGVLRDRRLGAAVLVRVQRRAARGVRRRGDAARARVGRAVVEPDHQRRAPAHARGGCGDRPVGVLRLRHHRARGARRRPGHVRRAVRRAGRQGRLHAGARREGRLPAPT